ncbi:MAG: Card1-like endonuclease domain-containing protein [Thermaurantimonas sp.]|uniref:Card1-like endonuclease domain-containing protein n=1 Tax=Thermaurantimonas sp. TaxID=2681568 RepID=UPI00391C3015
MRILVSAISDQPMPNYLLIKELKEVDHYVFITTQKMETKGKCETLATTAGIESDRYTKIIVSENELFQNTSKYAEADILNKENCTYLVNVTGGTKLMSIGMWHYFSGRKNAEFYYVPFSSKGYEKVYLNTAAEFIEFTYFIGAEEYLNLHGMKCDCKTKIRSGTWCNDVWQNLLKNDFNTQKLPKEFINNDGTFNGNLFGEWFEEFIYRTIKRELRLGDKFIKIGIKLKEKNPSHTVENAMNDNEIDVLVLYKNQPFAIECKTVHDPCRINTATLLNQMYKVASLNKRFGLSSRSILLTMAKLETLNEESRNNLFLKARLMGNIELMGNKELQENKIVEIIKNS